MGVSAYYYLNPQSLVYAGYLEPKDDNECILLYNQLLERDLGIPHTAKKAEGMCLYAFRTMTRYYPNAAYVNKKKTEFISLDYK